MALTDLQLVRKRIGDSLKTNTETVLVNPESPLATLSYKNIDVITVIDTEEGAITPLTVTTDFVVTSEPGVVTFLGLTEEKMFTIAYNYYAFTDAELQDLIDTSGVNGACAEAVRWLIADSSRLHDYSRGATSESLSQVTKNLQTMLKDYTALVDTEALVNSGDMVVLKRTNDFYRGSIPTRIDLSRDDSLS